MWWGRGRRGNVQIGPWPGAGPFSYLPPWQRPGWVYGRGAFNPYAGHPGASASTGYNPSVLHTPFMQREPYYQQSTPSYYPLQAPSSIIHPQQFTRGTAIHMNCIHFNNGFCTLKGIHVSGDGPACANFIPKT